ncbi:MULTISPECIES: flagellar export chaperone FlgN [Pseudoxanthomonas]|jgi:FlgN protein.|uniref:FlgN protein n=1 Tax=Pseudoxanthomonas taiwanensis J19 TaxID=935569 RepID=A0A562E425_9GAMM|nr:MULTISPECIES: flagellar export chaperone FlgN [Pseudoxanthomonas]RRN81031.1 flagellar protein FlgN [Pseudoxanthomonas sp. SGD-10]TWH16454.1 FlgN protein [Pseudoxanthomonas taiwanensis J19]
MHATVLEQMIAGLDRELEIYRNLARMLEEQYQVAARLDTAAMMRISESISQGLARLEDQGQARHPRLLEVARLLCGRSAQGLPAGAAFSAGQQAELEQRCCELRDMAVHCRTLTVRNGNLLAAQYETMSQVLYGESHTYAPAG